MSFLFQLLDETVKQLKQECQTLRIEKEQVEGLLAQSKGKAATIAKDLDAARTRCDDLVSESNIKEDERKQMRESLAVVMKEAELAMKASASSAGRSDGPASAFTMEQMNAQVKYLSNKIHCPVCNVRDKNCILLRCRHMFCHQCVDVNVKVSFFLLQILPLP
jgi:E3 ubiquitin-protein ligase BRE1